MKALTLLALFALLGQMVMISSGNMITVYLGLELMSLALYALIALRRDDAVATEAVAEAVAEEAQDAAGEGQA